MNKESLTDEEDEAHLLLLYTKIVCCATMFPYSPAAPGSETLPPPGRKSSFPNRSLLLLCFSFPAEEADAEISGTLSQAVDNHDKYTGRVWNHKKADLHRQKISSVHLRCGRRGTDF